MPDAVAPDPLRSDVRTIGLIGLAHGSSHFFHLLLPPLFPWLIAEFGYSYAELSVMVSLFFVVSGVGQAMAGFAVDRFGARPILFAALGSFTVAGVVASLAQGYGMLLLAAFFAGLGNAPFHPVDFTILNKRVSAKRIGHAFSVHGLSGNIGWALAPLFMAGITTATGSWRLACLCGAAGMLAGGFLVGRVQRLEKVISICMLGSGVALFLVGTGWLPAMAAVAVASIAGLGTGLAGPSRDMLIKRAAPPGATGRVYGTVYSGLDLGFCLAAPVFGYMLDHGMSHGVFYGSAIALVLSVVSAVVVGDGVSKKGGMALSAG